jgi:hypothetical protein
MRLSISVALLFLMVSATTAIGQESPPTASTPAPTPETLASPPRMPDYSRMALLRLVASASEDHPPIPKRVQWGFGTVEFPLFGTRFHVIWLPVLASLTPIGRHGSINPTIDPFEMTGAGVDLPMKPETTAERRELRRIERRLRRDKKQ